MKTRTDLLNFLAEKYKLESYLEIGVQVKALNYDLIKCQYKICVDPDPNAKATFCCTSDDYFTDHFEGVRYDLIFIDGLHTAEQVTKDFRNALKGLTTKGFIVLHDCNPEKEEHTIVPRPTERGHWNGDVYKFAIGLEKPFWGELIPHLPHTVDIDNGCMVIPHQRGIEWVGPGRGEDNWDYFDKNRKKLLNLVTWDEFIAAHSHV